MFPPRHIRLHFWVQSNVFLPHSVHFLVWKPNHKLRSYMWTHMQTHPQPIWHSTYQLSSKLKCKHLCWTRRKSLSVTATDEREVTVSFVPAGQNIRHNSQVNKMPCKFGSSNLNCPEFSSMTESGARASALPHKDEHNTYSLSFSFPKHHRTYCCFEGFWLSSQGTQSDQMQHSVLASGLIQRL